MTTWANIVAAAALMGAAGEPASSMNKRSMKIFKDLAKNGVKCLRPHEKILALPGAKDVRVFILGPPRNTERLEDLDPQGSEEFGGRAFSAATTGGYFAAAAARMNSESPFAVRYRIPLEQALNDPLYGVFFTQTYGADGTAPSLAEATLRPDPARRRGSAR
jgi:hypothetical protein